MNGLPYIIVLSKHVLIICYSLTNTKHIQHTIVNLLSSVCIIVVYKVSHL